MTQFISKAVLCFAPLALLCSLAHGQDIPAVTTAPTYQGFQLPTVLGTLHYALNFSELVRTGYYGTGSDIWGTSISGDAGYLSRSENHPFSMVYSGGYVHNSGSVPSSIFQNLTLSQTYTTRLWNTVVSDSVDYLPESPSSGLSGIPGVGDVGVIVPPVGGDTGQGILSRTGQRITNNTSLSIQRQLTGSTSLHGDGGYFIQRFLTDTIDAVNSQFISVQGGVNHRIDALSSVQGNYSYGHFSYEGQDFTFATQTFTVGYNRQLNRKLGVHATVGPQIVSSSGSPLASSSVNASIDAGMAYEAQHYDFSIDYTRGVRAGSGVVEGSFVDSVSAEGGRRLGEYMHIAGDVSYAHSSSIANLTSQPLDFQTVLGNVQVSRTVSRDFNVYVSYSLQDQQRSSLLATTAAFIGTSQTFGFGISYSPRQLHLGH
ncbi:MAG TPA: hypothetical protein VFC39_18765 [Acidobacteriaceae bacterium]|nr:hypothetical protein [Acidobacteriaceae bacterium]